METKQLEKLKNIFLEYKYPWVNPINNKIFFKRDLLLKDLKKFLTKEEFKFVYSKKYILPLKVNIGEVVNNMEIDFPNFLIKSPTNGNWYKFKYIFNHLSTYFYKKDTKDIIFKLLKNNNYIPKCCFTNKILNKQDLRFKVNKEDKILTVHPDNYFFNKYSYKLTKENYDLIHRMVLEDPKVIENRIKSHKEMFENPIRNLSWRKNIKKGMIGLDYSWIYNRTPEQKKIINKKSSDSQKLNILNGTFTPQNNYRTKRHFPCFIDGIEYTFRSSWEITFFISHSDLEYETLRIQYFDGNNNRIYIPDFIDIENKIIYELKPHRQYQSQILKMDGGIKWCLENNYKFIWVNEFNFLNYINENDNKDERNKFYYDKMRKGVQKL